MPLMKLSADSLAGLLVAFDIDDTLISEQEYIDSAFKAIEDNGYAQYDRLRNFCNAYDAINATVRPENIEAAISIYRKGNFNIRPVKDANKILTILKNAGATIAIITDGWSERQRNKLTNAGIIGYFDYIYISQEHESKDKLSGEPFRIIDSLYHSLKKAYIADNPAKDFYHANILDWNTIMIRDPKIMYVYPDKAPAKEYAAKHSLCNICDILPILYGSIHRQQLRD